MSNPNQDRITKAAQTLLECPEFSQIGSFPITKATEMMKSCPGEIVQGDVLASIRSALRAIIEVRTQQNAVEVDPYANLYITVTPVMPEGISSQADRNKAADAYVLARMGYPEEAVKLNAYKAISVDFALSPLDRYDHTTPGDFFYNPRSGNLFFRTVNSVETAKEEHKQPIVDLAHATFPLQVSRKDAAV